MRCLVNEHKGMNEFSSSIIIAGSKQGLVLLLIQHYLQKVDYLI